MGSLVLWLSNEVLDLVGGWVGGWTDLGPLMQRPVAGANVEEVINTFLVDLHVGDEHLRGEGGWVGR